MQPNPSFFFLLFFDSFLFIFRYSVSIAHQLFSFYLSLKMRDLHVK